MVKKTLNRPSTAHEPMADMFGATEDRLAGRGSSAARRSYSPASGGRVRLAAVGGRPGDGRGRL